MSKSDLDIHKNNTIAFRARFEKLVCLSIMLFSPHLYCLRGLFVVRSVITEFCDLWLLAIHKKCNIGITIKIYNIHALCDMYGT